MHPDGMVGKLIICLCVTRNIYDKAKVAVYSLSKCNPNAKIIVLCEDDNLEWQIPNVEYMNVSYLETDFTHNLAWTYMAKVRLVLHKLFNLDKIIYVDYDIVCLSSLDELWNIDLDGYDVGMVEEKDKPGYYNSGVLLINLERLRNGNGDELIKHINDKLRFPDQDLINQYWKIKPIDAKYNTGRCTNNGTVESAVIYHYMANPKPWDRRDHIHAMWWKVKEQMDGEGI